MNTTDRKGLIMGFLLGTIPVIWIALLAAPYIEDNIFDFLKNANMILKIPFTYSWWIKV